MIHLYVKQCDHCNLKYFGRTTSNPFTYTGSGRYWSAHIKHHQASITTISVWSFDNQNECSDIALSFSFDNNIVESKNWANLVPEDGTQGSNPRGYHHDEETRKRISSSLTGRKHSLIHRQRNSEAKKKATGPNHPQFGIKHSDERRLKNSLALRGRKLSPEHRAKCGQHCIGKKHSPETIDKMRKSKLERDLKRKALLLSDFD